LARFIVEVIDGLDLGRMSGAYRGSGSASYHPRMLLGLLVYGYATGVFSSRKVERATYDSVAFRFIAANDHPDHDTIATDSAFVGNSSGKKTRRGDDQEDCFCALVQA
jgi:transposase